MCCAACRIPGQSVDMAEPLAGLARCPVVVAPMAGGPSAPGLVIAAAAGDTGRMNLWAGEGFRAAAARPAAEIVALLAGGPGAA